MTTAGNPLTPPKRTTATLPKQNTPAPVGQGSAALPKQSPIALPKRTPSAFPKRTPSALPKQSGRHAKPSSADDTSISGSAAAALLGCGAGCALFSVAVVAAESSDAVKTALTLNEGVGPLSGVSVVGSLAYLGAWFGLDRAFQGRTMRTRTAVLVAGALVGLSLLLTFPPVYQLWAAE